MKAIFLCDKPGSVQRVYSDAVVKALGGIADIADTVYRRSDILADAERFADAEVIFSTWGMPMFTAEEIASYLPNLKAVFYAAGSVQAFARPFIERGVRVFSAWAANAVPVAEYTVAQIVLANKGFYRLSALMSAGNVREARALKGSYKGNMDENVGIIGAGMIGKLVIKMLRGYRLNVLVFDPFLSDDAAKELGVKKCGLEELFSSCRVVSNHLANNAQTKGMLGGSLFEKMLPDAAFINTGRGAQVVESELVEVLKSRPDIVALLDVTSPEPPVEGSELFTLPNCILTPHIAGSLGNEVHRMSEYILDEFISFVNDGPQKYEVTLKMLETMA
ncbi:MAG: hydroxyacid dehydrogenase [Clostridia bacterium]|nr:hydroxyacid dehydrogenase [Clostridia bacterium]